MEKNSLMEVRRIRGALPSKKGIPLLGGMAEGQGGKAAG
jgi:hypothetical protein